MNRAARAVFAGVVLVSASVITPVTASGATDPCKGNILQPAVHSDAVARVNMLTLLEAIMRQAPDPYHLNAVQIAALRGARVGVLTLDARIARTCYPSLAAFRADERTLYRGYRVFWLRVPQTYVIQAADELGEARAALGDVARELATYAGRSLRAGADLSTMKQVLRAADAKLGSPPKAVPSIATVAHLVPAPDMSLDDKALNEARANLVDAGTFLAQARTDAARVIADLQE